MKLEKAVKLVLKVAKVHTDTYEAFLGDQKDEIDLVVEKGIARIVEAANVVEDFFVNNVFVPEDETCDCVVVSKACPACVEAEEEEEE